MEIERKFWLTDFPTQYPELVHLETDQGYLVNDPVTVRIRSSRNLGTGESTYILCIKSRGTLSRHEVETPILPEQFEELASLLEHPMVHKDYHAYRLPDGHVLECSVVDHGAFSYAEVEFESEEEARAWEPLPFLGPELTYDKRFTMLSYYRNRRVPPLEELGGEGQGIGMPQERPSQEYTASGRADEREVQRRQR
jgi:CYTH domain-containing protein